MPALAHHAMKGRGLDPGHDFRVGSSHTTLDASADIDGWHCKIDNGREIGRSGVHQARSVSDTFEGENSVGEFVVLEPVDEEFRHAAQPLAHSNSPARRFFGAICARGKCGTVRAAHSTGKCIPPTNCGDVERSVVPSWNGMHRVVRRFATGARA